MNGANMNSFLLFEYPGKVEIEMTGVDESVIFVPGIS
jgi:hypothetical protein